MLHREQRRQPVTGRVLHGAHLSRQAAPGGAAEQSRAAPACQRCRWDRLHSTHSTHSRHSRHSMIPQQVQHAF